MNSLIVPFLAVLIAVNGQTRAKDKRVMGGSPVSIKDYPFQVAIVKDDELLCNGVIIAKYHVLTVPQCVSKMKKNVEYEARSGKSIWSAKGFPVKFSTNDITIYSSDIFAVALIRGNKSFLSGQRPTETIKLVNNNLFCKNPDYLARKVARVSGWGICNNCGGVLIPGQLRSVETMIQTREWCSRHLYKLNLDDTMICAGVEGKQIGPYNPVQDPGDTPDIGSPLVIGDELVGLFVNTIGYFSPGEPGLYVNVAKFKSWIDEKLRNEKVK